MELKVHIQHEPQFRGTSIYLYGKDNQGEFIVEPMDFVIRHYTPGEATDRPTLFFPDREGEAFLQSLVQALVQIGFKPDEIKAVAGELSAIKYHLEDMRTLVFKGQQET